MIRKISTLKLLAIVLIAWLIFNFVYEGNIYSSATSISSPSTEHTVPLAIHGRIIFITKEQKNRLSSHHWTNFVPLVLILLIIIVKLREEKKSLND